MLQEKLYVYKLLEIYEQKILQRFAVYDMRAQSF